MKAILFACIAVAVIAVVGNFVLGSVQIPADEGYADHIAVRV